MKSYFIDEIPSDDMEKIEAYLSENAEGSAMDKLFWISIPSEHLAGLQPDHSECSPHRFAIETGDDWIKAEFFIRTSTKFRCECSEYCNDNQKNFVINYIDTILEQLNIRT